MADENKSLLGLVNGLARNDYYKEAGLDEEFLKSQLYPAMTDEDFKHLVQRVRGLTKSMAMTDMDFNQAEVFLTSQTKKKEGGITEDQAKVYMKFWRTHKSRIHESLVSQATWDNSLKGMSWRIDVKTRARHIDQLNSPTAIVELQLQNHKETTKEPEVLRFEMDETIMNKVLTSMTEIQDQIQVHCQQTITN